MSKIEAFRVLDLASAGLAAENRRLEVIAANLANAHTLRTPEGGPYRRREVVFEAVYDEAGRRERVPTVKVAGVVADASDFRRVLQPGHPEADAEGYVTYPNVDPVFEMVDLMEAMRAYEANLRSSKAFKTMAESALQIGR
jgi:flagellar basal-body rod protein FlgC